MPVALSVDGPFNLDTTVAFRYGEYLVASYAVAKNVSAPTGLNSQFLAMCFAGAWLSRNYTYTDAALVAGTAFAMSMRGYTSSNIDEVDTREFVRAMQIGTNGFVGNTSDRPSQCYGEYWK